ncbi:MAG: Ribonuclease 3 [Chlamydiae bacterium]|nr:Ribonuclease 3 [Chlamydiota bacterium]
MVYSLFMNTDYFPQTAEVEAIIGYQFTKPELLTLALIHPSYWNEHRDAVPGHNERLEFLGDSILGLMVAQYLYQKLPETPEGVLSDLRAQIVEATSCALYVKKLGVGSYILLGKGESMNVGKGRETIFADFLEALIGAIYLDKGFSAAEEFFFRNFTDELEKVVAEPAHNWKAELQEYAQKTFQVTPEYKVIAESGPSHNKIFRVAVFIGDDEVGQDEGSSKKEAQAKAAEQAMRGIGED